MKLFVSALVSLAVMGVSLVASADAVVKNSGAHQGSYGMAGCGLGAVLFKGKNDKVSQILAATTNGTSGNQTFGITTGTLECTDAGTLSVAQMKKVFVEANYDRLALEMAQGQGDYLTVMAAFYGCQGQEATSFGQLTQSQYEDLFSSENSAGLVNKMDQHFSASTLAQTCGA